MTHDHLTDEDLVSVHYLQIEHPHLHTCDRCRRAAAQIATALHGAVADSSERPDSYWARQRHAVWRQIGAEQAATWSFRRRAAVAAAALFVTVLAGGIIERELPAQDEPAAVQQGITAVPTTELTADPWESDAIEPYRAAVEWESWLDESDTGETLR